MFKCLLAKYNPKNIYIFSKTVFKDKKSWTTFLRLMDQTDPKLLETNVFMTSDKLM
jgi:hypothetical protein